MDTKELSKLMDVVEDLTERYRRSLIVPKAGCGGRAEVDEQIRLYHRELMAKRVWGPFSKSKVAPQGLIRGERA